jgi:hypothetical protein
MKLWCDGILWKVFVSKHMFRSGRKFVATNASRNIFADKITSRFIIVGQSTNKRTITGWTRSKNMFTSKEINKWSKKRSQ